MKSLEEIKDEYAKSINYSSWGHFLSEAGSADVNMALPIIANDYATTELQEAWFKIYADDSIMEQLELPEIKRLRNYLSLIPKETTK